MPKKRAYFDFIFSGLIGELVFRHRVESLVNYTLVHHKSILNVYVM